MSSKFTKPATILLFIVLMAAFIAYKAGVFDSRQPDVSVTYERKITLNDSIGADSLPIADTQVIKTTTTTTQFRDMKLSTSKSLIVDDGRENVTPKKVISIDSFYLDDKDILMSSKSSRIFTDSNFHFRLADSLRTRNH